MTERLGPRESEVVGSLSAHILGLPPTTIRENISVDELDGGVACAGD